jgi:hypothetical protein
VIGYKGKMAERQLCFREQSAQVEVNSVLNQTSLCKSGIEYQCTLEELTQELQSAKKIIQLIQDDINKSKDHTSFAIPRSPGESNTSSVSNSANNWKKVLHKTNKRTDPLNSLNNQWPIPVISTSNRFDTLHNLKIDRQITDSGTILPSRTKGNGVKPRLRKRTTKGSQVKTQNKIIMIGDSHTRGLTSEIKNHLGREYSTSSTFMPGAGLQNITNLAKNEVKTLTKCDMVIVCGGSNDVNRKM